MDAGGVQPQTPSMKSIKSGKAQEMATGEPGEDTVGSHASHSPRPAAARFHLRSLLVPVDFSGCSLSAVDYALGLAQPFGATVTLLHVVEPAVFPENHLMSPPEVDETNRSLIEAGRERLASVIRQRRGNDRVSIESLVRLGRAHSEISDTAKALGIDLIVMATHGSTGLRSALMGSTAERVVRGAPCPVLTVRAADPPPSAGK